MDKKHARRRNMTKVKNKNNNNKKNKKKNFWGRKLILLLFLIAGRMSLCLYTHVGLETYTVYVYEGRKTKKGGKEVEYLYLLCAVCI